MPTVDFVTEVEPIVQEPVKAKKAFVLAPTSEVQPVVQDFVKTKKLSTQRLMTRELDAEDFTKSWAKGGETFSKPLAGHMTAASVAQRFDGHQTGFPALQLSSTFHRKQLPGPCLAGTWSSTGVGNEEDVATPPAGPELQRTMHGELQRMALLHLEGLENALYSDMRNLQSTIKLEEPTVKRNEENNQLDLDGITKEIFGLQTSLEPVPAKASLFMPAAKSGAPNQKRSFLEGLNLKIAPRSGTASPVLSSPASRTSVEPEPQSVAVRRLAALEWELEFEMDKMSSVPSSDLMMETQRSFL